MNKSNLIIGLVAVAALVVGVTAFTQVPDAIQGAKGDKGEQGIPGRPGRDGVDGVTTVKTVPAVPNPVLGGLSSPDVSSPYFSFGGVRRWAASTDSLTQATTTICALLSPSSTSTLVSATLRLDVSSTSASIIDIAKSSNAFATTTKIGTTYYIAAGAQAAIVASSTGSVAGDATIFAPNQYLVVNMKGGLTNVFSPTGSCKAVWQQL